MELRLVFLMLVLTMLTSAACVAAFNVGQLMNPILASHGVRADIRGRI